jgi:Na+-transporting NADH:ubiquinone oxidoreductase subunit NqrC
MQERENKNINGKPLSITILLSLIAGFLISLWAINLNPKGNRRKHFNDSYYFYIIPN